MAKREEQLVEELERLRRQLAERGDSDGGIMGFLGGLALGTLVGGALAIVFAPQSGEQTREQLRETSIELKDRATQVAGQAREQADTLQTQAQEVLGQAKDQVQSVTTRVQGIAADAKDKAQDVAQTAQQTVQRASGGASQGTPAAAQGASSGAQLGATGNAPVGQPSRAFGQPAAATSGTIAGDQHRSPQSQNITQGGATTNQLDQIRRTQEGGS